MSRVLTIITVTVIYVTIEYLLRIQGNDECCYIYGSLPKNRNNCVPEGEQLAINYIIYYPHENFTNLTVTWFRSTTRDVSTSEMIRNIPEEYSSFNSESKLQSDPKIPIRNCSVELYRDTFILTINNFTRDKSGYYWCQLVIDDVLYAQPSPGAWFYAGEYNSTTCNRSQYFKVADANEAQCAQFMIMNHVTPVDQNTNSTLKFNLLPSSLQVYELSTVTSSTVTVTSPTETKQEQIKKNSTILFVTVSIITLLLMCVVVVTIPVTIYFYKLRKEKSGNLLEYHAGEVIPKIQGKTTAASSGVAHDTTQATSVEDNTYDVIDDIHSSLKPNEYDYIEFKSLQDRRGLKVSPHNVVVSKEGDIDEAYCTHTQGNVGSVYEVSFSENRETEVSKFNLIDNPAYVVGHIHSANK